MDTLHDRLVQLADDAPTGGAPAAELWARGKRAQRLHAAALGVTLLMAAVVGTGIGVRVADSNGNRSVLTPATTVGFPLPIEYPAGTDLPNLGNAPGALAAIWLVPHVDGGAPEAVGLVAETGVFGTLPIDLPDDDPQAPLDLVALSPDGRRIAYPSREGKLIVYDLVRGEDDSPVFDFQIRSPAGGIWVDATHLVGLVAKGSDADGWVWEPGTAPKLANPHPYLEDYGRRDGWSFLTEVDGPPGTCQPPTLLDRTGRVEVPVLCDVLALIGSEFVLGHRNNPDDGGGTVVALDIRGVTTHPFGGPLPEQESQFDDPGLRHVVLAAGAPERVTFATDLIGAALAAAGGAS